jgi:hypothetical protein
MVFSRRSAFAARQGISDPIVLAHGEAMLATDDNTTFIGADMREPDVILGDPRLKALIDFDEPVAVLEFVPDDEEAAGLVRRFAEAMPPGSRSPAPGSVRTRSRR